MEIMHTMKIQMKDKFGKVHMVRNEEGMGKQQLTGPEPANSRSFNDAY